MLRSKSAYNSSYSAYEQQSTKHKLKEPGYHQDSHTEVDTVKKRYLMCFYSVMSAHTVGNKWQKHMCLMDPEDRNDK